MRPFSHKPHYGLCSFVFLSVHAYLSSTSFKLESKKTLGLLPQTGLC